MAVDILAVIAAVLLFYFGYSNWYASRVVSVVGIAVGLLLLISLAAVYLVVDIPGNPVTTSVPEGRR